LSSSILSDFVSSDPFSQSTQYSVILIYFPSLFPFHELFLVHISTTTEDPPHEENMSYNRPPYQPYDDANPNQPYPVGYPPEMPPYQGQPPYDSFAYPAPPYGDPSYPSDPPRRDSYGYPRDYDGI